MNELVSTNWLSFVVAKNFEYYFMNTIQLNKAMYKPSWVLRLIQPFLLFQTGDILKKFQPWRILFQLTLPLPLFHELITDLRYQLNHIKCCFFLLSEHLLSFWKCNFDKFVTPWLNWPLNYPGIFVHVKIPSYAIELTYILQEWR